MERAHENLLNSKDSISPSFSYDGYEQLHDEAMDKISVSLRNSDEAFEESSRNNLTQITQNCEKKMKISLSQEQLKLKSGNRNFLSVPKTVTKKARSASFFFLKRDEGESFKDEFQSQKSFESSSSENQTLSVTLPKIKTINASDDDEVIYAVPNVCSKKKEKEIATSRDGLVSSNSVVTSSAVVASNKSFKYPLSFYCKICNNVLSDPRTLDCLHSFCLECLAKLDASTDLQNNQFWRKISEHSESSCEFKLSQTG